jgi:regulator of sirC expression with transglutaminase-like and TPR domain
VKNTKEIKALIKLLDDNDQEVFTHVHDKLFEYGSAVIPSLETEWEGCFNPTLQERIENLIHEIQFTQLQSDMKIWAASPTQDLLEGVFIICRYQFPDFNDQEVRNKIDDIKRDIWVEMNNDMSPLEKVKLINHVLYTVHGFSGNTKNYHDPQNSFINKVLESKKGNQISLAIIYAIVAQGLDIPIYGVNLPQHFILSYQDNEEDAPEELEKIDGVLFYINAFNKGFVFAKRDIDYFLKQLNLEPMEDYYKPCANSEILKRVVRNLVNSYEKSGSIEKSEELNKLYDILDGKTD